jgi:hypothetical protein
MAKTVQVPAAYYNFFVCVDFVNFAVMDKFHARNGKVLLGLRLRKHDATNNCLRKDLRGKKI